MRVTVRKKGGAPEERIVIHTEFIKLESALKMVNAVPSGGQAKLLIQEGEAMVNGEVCTMRGKKLRPGDVVTFLGGSWRVTAEDAP